MRPLALRFIRDFVKNDVIGTAAQTAFFLTLSIPPMLILVLSVGSSLNAADALVAVFGYVFPENVSEVLLALEDALPKSSRVTLVSALGVVFSASGSTWALMRGIHKAYTCRKLHYTLKNRLFAAVITALFIIIVTVSLGSLIIRGILSSLLSTFSNESFLYSFSNTALSIGLIYAFVHFLYKFTPNVSLKGRELFWGAIFSAFGWVLVSTLFGIYIKSFTKYTTVYVGIGAFFILILWLYVISFIVLTGAQINGTLYETCKGRHNIL